MEKKERHKNNVESLNELQKRDKALGGSNPNGVIGSSGNAGPPNTLVLQTNKEIAQNAIINAEEKKKRIYSKKIIDHLEYLSLSEGFSNTDNHDPHEKELRQLM